MHDDSEQELVYKLGKMRATLLQKAVVLNTLIRSGASKNLDVDDHVYDLQETRAQIDVISTWLTDIEGKK